VIFVDSLVDAASISSITKRADCALMPYRNSAYYGRLSRAAIDAVVCGCPVIYPYASSIAEIVASYGVGVCFEDESVSSLASSIVEVSHNYRSLKVSALAKTRKAIDYFSPENHAKVILGTINHDGVCQ
jgi:glycosyltransferase involved in cell wall biosynthesis